MLAELSPAILEKPDEVGSSCGRAQPFLRWAGGKRQLVPALLSHLPHDVVRMPYFEPFLGAGSLFFAVQPSGAVLGDANTQLIETYRALRDDPDGVRDELARLIGQHSKEHYYAVRATYNVGQSSCSQAARFIYLNKTCFNGIFRVNTSGQFNVPKGGKDKLAMPSEEEYSLVSKSLSNSRLLAASYTETLSLAGCGSFAYLDPPYPPLNETAYFTHYTSDRFGHESQEALAEEVRKLHNRGVYFLMSNADTPVIRELYSGFVQESISVQRYVSCKGKRLRVSELLIWNY
jgi:DNA adenine methylase